MLHPQKEGLYFTGNGFWDGLGHQNPDFGVELIDVAHRANAQMILFNPAAIAQTRHASIAGSRCNF
jgi:hypothetical protein